METLTSETPTAVTHEKRHLLTDQLYQLLLNAQQDIYEKTDIRVTFRKLLNELITEQRIHEITETWIRKLTM